MVHRRFMPLLGILVLIGALNGASALASRHATLQVRHTRVGPILVDGQGYTLYSFTKDGRNRDVCAAIASCLRVWPALVSSHPSAGPGVKRRLMGTIEVAGVGRQVTYAGHPLYTFIDDSRAAETDNLNKFQSGGYWPGIAPSGRAIR
jgi:predicted lipoprotein with Yx(FWY)xxD motif